MQIGDAACIMRQTLSLTLSKQHADRCELWFADIKIALQHNQATNVLSVAQHHKSIDKLQMGMLLNTTADLQMSRHASSCCPHVPSAASL